MTNVISVQSAVRRYGELLAVDGLSFDVQKGDVFGLLGPNGAGKTTTIHLLTGLLDRHAGKVEVLGFDPVQQSRQVHQQIGYVPQETNMYMDLNAEENLWHHAALYCADLTAVPDRIDMLLNTTNLWERRRDRVRTYSGGMKRRLALARALLHDPQVIFFDEPTLGVDVQGKHAIWDHVQEQRESGKTFVVSTNDMQEADALCDRLLILDHGRVVTAGSPEELKAELGRDVVTLRTSPGIKNAAGLVNAVGGQAMSQPEPGMTRFEVRDAEKLVEDIILAVRKDYRLESIRIARPSLDDVFLHHTGRALRDG